jgi:predicted RNase H-like nuclease
MMPERLLNSTRVRTDDEISDWVTAYAAGLVVVAVDAPLIVPNPTGLREPERLDRPSVWWLRCISSHNEPEQVRR